MLGVGAGDDELVQGGGAFPGNAQGGQEPPLCHFPQAPPVSGQGRSLAGVQFQICRCLTPPRTIRASGQTMRCQGTSSTRAQGARSIRAEGASAVTHRGAMLRARALAEQRRTVLALMGGVPGFPPDAGAGHEHISDHPPVLGPCFGLHVRAVPCCGAGDPLLQRLVPVALLGRGDMGERQVRSDPCHQPAPNTPLT